jgi:hypothetical protein
MSVSDIFEDFFFFSSQLRMEDDNPRRGPFCWAVKAGPGHVKRAVSCPHHVQPRLHHERPDTGTYPAIVVCLFLH